MIDIKNNRYKYFELIRELAITDFKLKYQGSVFGYLWSLVKPLAYFAVLYTVFTRVFHIGNEIPHYPIYLLMGVMMFSFWGEATAIAMSSIAYKGDLIRKVYFPRIVLVLSSTLTSLITFTLNILVLLAFAYFSGVRLGFHDLWLIPIIIELYFFIVGVSFYLAAFFVKFRDIGHIWEVTNQILLYATPIIYPLSLVPAKYAKFMILSPLAQTIQDARNILIGSDMIMTIKSYWSFYFIPYLLVIFLFVTGYYIFQMMAARFAEEV
jgi:ABC-2 type transport system permease protein